MTEKENDRSRLIVDLESIFCLFYRELSELITRLFVTCYLAVSIWYINFKWLGLGFILPNNLIAIFLLSRSLGCISKIRGSLSIICYVEVLSFWKSYNDIIFTGSSISVKDVKDKRIFLAWKWYLGKYVKNSYAFFSWLENPIVYLSQ